MTRESAVGFEEQVTTRSHFDAPPTAVWRCLMFYEDVPRSPWRLLRWALPQPLRSEGDKLSVGGVVRCTYRSGYLIKRIRAVEPPRALRFEVVEQHLGIERRARAAQGAYVLRAVGAGTELALTTHYRGFLRPRWLWRRLEHYACHGVHRHILRGMQEALAGANAASGGEKYSIEARSR